jgi:hypothetical protein
LADGTINGVRCMGIAFEASGPLHGTLPDRPSLALAGTITMHGTAYYAYENALLQGLEATLAIEGNIDAATAQKEPVSIVYTRSIRSAPGQVTAGVEATPSPTPTPRRTPGKAKA